MTTLFRAVSSLLNCLFPPPRLFFQALFLKLSMFILQRILSRVPLCRQSISRLFLVLTPWLEVRVSSRCREALLTPSIQQTCFWAPSDSSHPFVNSNTPLIALSGAVDWQVSHRRAAGMDIAIAIASNHTMWYDASFGRFFVFSPHICSVLYGRNHYTCRYKYRYKVARQSPQMA
jgi:hypothetical protein